MFEERDTKAPKQGEFWVVQGHLPAGHRGHLLPQARRDPPCHRLRRGRARDLPARLRRRRAGGRPGIDPAVYFKMLMIGFFENLPSERAIASRCADSLSLRAFLGYDLDRGHPRSLQPVGHPRAVSASEIYQAALELVLKGLRDHTACSKAATSASTPASSRPTPACANCSTATPRRTTGTTSKARRRGRDRSRRHQGGAPLRQEARGSQDQQRGLGQSARPRGQGRPDQGRRLRHDLQARARHRSGERSHHPRAEVRLGRRRATAKSSAFGCMEACQTLARAAAKIPAREDSGRA